LIVSVEAQRHEKGESSMKTGLAIFIGLCALLFVPIAIGATSVPQRQPSTLTPSASKYLSFATTGLPQHSAGVELVGQLGGNVTTVAVSGTQALLGVGPRVVIVNLSDPAQFARQGQTPALAGIIVDVAVAGHYA
jgi:hypothetical protein